MSDDPFADGGDDAFVDGGEDVFGESTNDGEDAFGTVNNDNDGDDPFGDDGAETGLGLEEQNDFQPMGDESNELGGGNVGGGFMNMDSNEQKAPEIPAPGPVVPEEEDCSALNAWRTEWRNQLEAKATEATSKKNERRQSAEEERRGMKDARDKALEARMEGNRQDEMTFLEEREKLAQPGANPWERVVSLVDTQVDDLEKAKATERMRTILIQMKGQKTGPGIP